MYLRLGNVKVNEIENSLGISFNEADKKFLIETRVDQVSSQDPRCNDYKIPADTWHAFELPFLQIHCGSKRFAEKVTNIIKKYMNDGAFPKEGAKIGITNELLEEEKFGYSERQNMIEKGLEVYVGRVENKDKWDRREIRFFVKSRETKTMVVLQQVEAKRDPNVMSNLIVPNVDAPYSYRTYEVNSDGTLATDENGEFVTTGVRVAEPLRKKMNPEKVYIFDDYYSKMTLTLWDGKPIENKY